MWCSWSLDNLPPPLRAPRLTLGARDVLWAPRNVRRGGDFAKFYPYTRVKMEFPLSSSHAARPYERAKTRRCAGWGGVGSLFLWPVARLARGCSGAQMPAAASLRHGWLARCAGRALHRILHLGLTAQVTLGQLSNILIQHVNSMNNSLACLRHSTDGAARTDTQHLLSTQCHN